MKKLLAILLALVMITSLAACSSESGENTPSESQPPVSTQGPANTPAEDDNNAATPSENNEPQDGGDAVTSASINVMADGGFAGNAELMAGMAQQATGGDLFLIQTVDTYPSDYRDTTDQAKVEQNNDARPELASHVENMDQYDTIVLIYPNWWGTLPQPVMTFLEEYDFSGKTILPLCTHEGSRMGSSERAIASLCPDATLLDGLAVRGGSAASAQSDVETWINNSGILG